MLEVLAIVALVLAFFGAVFVYLSYRRKLLAEQAQRSIASCKEKLRIAERKFLQGKIKKSIFDSIVEEIEGELFEAELFLFRLRKAGEFEVDYQAGELVKKMSRPTSHRRAKAERILAETELLRHELGLLESKLLRREIKETVFDRLTAKKEAELIQKEKELTDLVSQANA